MADTDTVEVIPLVEERVLARKRAVETGRIRIRTITDEEETVVRDELLRSEVEIERVPIDRVIDVVPEPRQEGDILIIPVVGERLVVEKRLVLKEELHIRRRQSLEPFEQAVTLRSQRAIVEREQSRGDSSIPHARSSPMSRTITALFDNRQDAEAAADRLRQSRIDADRIHVIDQNSPGYSDRASTQEDRGIWASIKDFFLPDEDRHTYEEGIRRGCVLVTARVEELEADEAVRILEESRSVDLDQRQAEWRSSGWTGMPSGETSAASTGAGMRARGEAVSEEHIPIVEEQLRVGKREVSRGGVRVRSYVVETPVHEDVTLREEHVSVERRPVGERVSTAGLNEADLMRERTVEVSESAEEAVVSKEAMVREELVIRKTAEEHVESIDETVRHTEVDIEKEGERTEAERDRIDADRDRRR